MSELALKLVKKCQATQDPYLDLGKCGLTDEDFVEGTLLDKELRKCHHLESLILSNEFWNYEMQDWLSGGNNGKLNFFTFCPFAISSLSNLKALFLSGEPDNRWKINDLRPIGNLHLLVDLNLSCNDITQLQSLRYLSTLKNLFLYGNQIQSLEDFTYIQLLDTLDIGDNNIGSLKGLENLKSLRHLELDKNKIKKLDSLRNLLSLKILNLSANEIKDITGIEGLKSLTRLDLSKNRIKDLRPLNVLLKNVTRSMRVGSFDLPIESYTINIGSNPLTSPPLEIARQGNLAILNYFEELDKRGAEYLYEAKMLIVGQPRAGKTSLRDKLFNVSAPLPDEDKTTRGIDIKRLDFDITDRENKSRKFYYNVWDFGGQHIYQTTHQFFLTHRSLYALVIDTGKDSTGNDDTTINYWLQAVELLGGNSPMLLVRNEKNERQVNLDLPQKRARFAFLKGDYSVDLNALIAGTPEFSDKRFNEFDHLKEDIQTELKRLPLVGFPMPKNWAAIRKQLQVLSETKHYISRHEFIELCKTNHVIEFARQMELSRIFHDLGVFLHFQDFVALEDFIILQNTWATDAVFAVFDNKKVQASKGRFSASDLAEIWKEKDYEPSVHRKLLELMMQFELCYLVDKSNPNVYIIPEMLTDRQTEGTPWKAANDLPIQYEYDFMPRGILTRFIVRMHKNIALHKGQQIVWKTGVRIDGNSLDCPQTIAEITEAWDNKKLDIKVQGTFSKSLMSIISSRIDELNKEFFRQVSGKEDSQKSRWYKMIPCNCVACKNAVEKYFYDYAELVERKGFGKATIECKKKPYADVNITDLLEGVFANNGNNKDLKNGDAPSTKTVTLFLASSSELKAEREQFELFIGRENKQLHKKGLFLRLEVWEDFLDQISQTRLQDEYNEAVKSCDIFVMLYFTKVGKFTAEEFETAFKTFKETNKPKIYTYFKKAPTTSTAHDREGTTSLWAFQDKLKELGHYQTVFENDAQLHLHFKKQLEKLYDL